MTRNWHRLMALVVALATSLGGALYAQEQSAQENAEEQKNEAQAQEEPQAEEKNEGAAAQDDSLQFDENLPPADESGDESDAASLEQELEKAVDADLGDAVKENSAEDLLNLATETKLGATTLLDLTKVISLCNKAEQRGLDEVNLEFAKQLRISAMLDRGLAIAQIFIDPDLQLDQLPRGWQGLRDHAITDLQTALDEYQDIPVAQMSLGRLFMLCDKPEDAKKAFDAAINSEEEDDGGPDVRTLALMFRAMLESDPRKALPYVDQGIDKYPEHEPRLYAMAAEYLNLMNRVDDAIVKINKAIELDPENASYKKVKAVILAKSQRFEEARKIFDEAIKNEPQDTVAVMLEKAQFYADIRAYQDAINVYDEMAEKFNGPGVYFLRGALRAQMKEYDKALQDADEALKRDPNMLQAIRLKGVVHIQREEYDEAIRILEQLRRKSHDDAEKREATSQIAYVISKQGYYKRASDMLKKELEKTPDDPDLLRSLADMELLFGHWQNAIDLYEKLVSIDPKDSGSLNNYSWLLSTCPDEAFRNGERALEYAKTASEETFYKQPHILSTLAAAYAELGDFETARSWSQKAVELGEKIQHESLDSLKKELESYKENKPWREEASEIQVEKEEEATDAEVKDDEATEDAEETEEADDDEQ